MHTPNGKRAARLAVALSILGLLATMDLCWSRNASAAATTVGRKGVTVQAVEYSGQATLINFTNIHMGPPFVIIGDTGPLPTTGGNIEISSDATNMVGLSLDLSSASTRGIDDASSSSVSLNNLSVTIETLAGTRHTLVVDTIALDATATCTATGGVLTANSQIVGLKVDDTVVEVTGQPNQVVDLGDASLVINEQVLTYGDMSAAIALAAIHIIDPGCLDGLVGLVHADIKCNSVAPPPPTSQCDDFVTGGGWIPGPNNCKANFGVAGGIRKDAFWGHLNFIDHGTQMHVKSTAVTAYEVTDATTRTINFDVTIDGEAGTAVVRVVDNGEPGRDDVFQISLSNGYVASGTLGGDQPGGGNIQLHHGKCHDVDCEHKCPKCGHKCHHEHKDKKCKHECDRGDHKCPYDQNKCEHHCDKCNHECEHHDHNPGKCSHKCDRKDHKCPWDQNKCMHKCDKCGHKCEKHDHNPAKCDHKCDRSDHKCPWDQNKCVHKCAKCDHQCEKHDHNPGKCAHKCDGKDHKCPGDTKSKSNKDATANGGNKDKAKGNGKD